MQHSNILDLNESQLDYSWTDPIERDTAFGKFNLYSFGTKPNSSTPSIFKKIFKHPNLTKIQFQERQKQLLFLDHQNFVPVQYRSIQFQRIKNQQRLKQFQVVSPYIKSISVSNFITQKRQLLQSNFFTIIQQVVNLMHYAETSKIHHYHFNANSILFVKNDNQFSQDYFVKICDWGYPNQVIFSNTFKNHSEYLEKMAESFMFEYLHPQILFSGKNAELLQNYKSKYDIWSFGIILYRIFFSKRPFENNGSFSPQKLEKYYKSNLKLEISQQCLLSSLIRKMLDLKGFQSWSQIKQYLMEKDFRVQSDFLGIKSIYIKHINVMNYMIQIYKLSAWSIFNSANCFWYENKLIMTQFLRYLLKLMDLLHSNKFLERFGHRMLYLSEQQKKTFRHLSGLIRAQLEKVTTPESSLLESFNFFQNFQKFSQYLSFLQLKIDDYQSDKSMRQKSGLGVRFRESWRSMKAIKKFSFEMVEVRKKIKSCNCNIFESFFAILQEQP